LAYIFKFNLNVSIKCSQTEIVIDISNDKWDLPFGIKMISHPTSKIKTEYSCPVNDSYIWYSPRLPRSYIYAFFFQKWLKEIKKNTSWLIVINLFFYGDQLSAYHLTYTCKLNLQYVHNTGTDAHCKSKIKELKSYEIF
jgi:hypothetical protein